MAHLISTTFRLEEEDVRALKRARADGLSASDLDAARQGQFP
jgi:hypothetical protein